MTSVLICMAHCDDELIWGWPWLLDRTLDRRVLICSSDRLNPQRQSYRRGEEALAAVCHDVGVSQCRVLSQYHSEFYKLRTRGPGSGPILKDWWETASKTVLEMSAGCDYIVTHNPIFNYGHLDHMLVHRMIYELPNRPQIKWTDAVIETGTWPLGVFRWFEEDVERAVSLAAEEFEPLKQHYVSRDCWTWSRDVPLQVRILRERDGGQTQTAAGWQVR